MLLSNGVQDPEGLMASLNPLVVSYTKVKAEETWGRELRNSLKMHSCGPNLFKM